MNKTRFLLFLLGVLPLAVGAQSLESPDGCYRFSFCKVDGGMGYAVTIYTDDPTLTTRSKVATKTTLLKAGRDITLQLLPSGGAALHFKPTDY